MVQPIIATTLRLRVSQGWTWTTSIRYDVLIKHVNNKCTQTPQFSHVINAHQFPGAASLALLKPKGNYNGPAKALSGGPWVLATGPIVVTVGVRYQQSITLPEFAQNNAQKTAGQLLKDQNTWRCGVQVTCSKYVHLIRSLLKVKLRYFQSNII